MGLVCRADFHHLRAAGRHDIGQPERPSDFNQLPARNDHLAPLGQRAQCDHRGGGIVVDDRGRLGSCELLEQAFHARVPPVTLSGFGILLEDRVAAKLGGNLIHCGLRQDGAPQPRMQNDARGIDRTPVERHRCRAKRLFNPAM